MFKELKEDILKIRKLNTPGFIKLSKLNKIRDQVTLLSLIPLAEREILLGYIDGCIAEVLRISRV